MLPLPYLQIIAEAKFKTQEHFHFMQTQAIEPSQVPLSDIIDNGLHQLSLAVMAATHEFFPSFWTEAEILDAMDTLTHAKFNFDEIGDPVEEEAAQLEAWHCLRMICRDGNTAYRVLEAMLEHVRDENVSLGEQQ
jgi:hypothetical protein